MLPAGVWTADAMSAVIIRAARPDDRDALSGLIARSARALSVGFYRPSEIESAIAHVFGVDSSLIADGTYFVVEREGIPAACGGWSARRSLYGGDQRPSGTQDLLDPSHDAARIRAFFVAPEAARQGLGRLLYRHCETAAAAAGFRSLELVATLPGVPFYASLGFAPVEEITDTLPDGVCVRFIRMQRPLPLPRP